MVVQRSSRVMRQRGYSSRVEYNVVETSVPVTPSNTLLAREVFGFLSDFASAVPFLTEVEHWSARGGVRRRNG